MRRRSSILPSVPRAPPVREDEVYGLLGPSRHSLVPRQLSYEKTRISDVKLEKGRYSTIGRASFRPSITAKSDESICNTTALSQIIAEVDCTIAESKAPKGHVLGTAALKNISKDQSSIRNKASVHSSLLVKPNEGKINVPVRAPIIPVKETTSHIPETVCIEDAHNVILTTECKNKKQVNLSTSVSENKSLDSTERSCSEDNHGKSIQGPQLNESKIPKPKYFSSKASSPDSHLNSTAAFEEVEIAALTSTPHPERSSRRRPALSANTDLEVNLFLAEQRSLMQAIKLSFQKLNMVLDSQLQINLETASLLKQIKENQGSLQINTLLKQTLNSDGISDFPLACTENISHNFSSQKLSSKAELSPCLEEKENIEVNCPFKPDSLYQTMKSQLACLKTPTALRKATAICAETPKTCLSNTIHHQLESLFEEKNVE